MLDTLNHSDLEAPVSASGGALTGRRMLFATLVGVSVAGLLWLAAVALSVAGFTALDGIILALFAVTLPWSVIGFWNATIGFLLMRFSRDPIVSVLPVAGRVRGDEPITASTAILVCIRNEGPERVVRNLSPMIAGLVAAGVADRFHVYVLSDTNDAAIAALEDKHFGALAAAWRDRLTITYRRRTDNTAFKAGNIRDFCERWGAAHEFAIPLDADSVMTAEAALRLVRIVQADPKLGILQGLVVGLPSTSAFARIFQFGMRLGMRSYTIGSAWWQGDCGPYWGHNAVIRLAPFIAHCHLPPRQGGGALGGHILSHDQLEAVLMRRAGFEVRVLPEENLGWEENPPTLLDFIRRDLRWCQGNMQYWPFILLPGLKPVSRYQLVLWVLMFVSSPAWIALLIIGTAVVAFNGAGGLVRPDAGRALFAIILVMWFAPKILTVVDVLSRAEARRAFGGTVRIIVSVVIETVFFLMLSPIMWLDHTMFFGGLLFGRAIGWGGQTRDDHAVPIEAALRELWPHTLLGLGCLGVLVVTAPAAIPYALLLAGGLALSVPLAVVTSLPAVGRMLLRLGIGRLPEETAPPPILRTLALPALEAAAERPLPRPA
jgi:membrane glycosyltransferase